MVQEIITYLIIFSAIIWAVIKVYRRFKKPSKFKKSTSKKEIKLNVAHNCTDCSSGDCALRDLPKKVIEKNIEQCNENVVKSQ